MLIRQRTKAPKMARPIIVAGPCRAGSSLTMEIVHRHGAWIGKTLKAGLFNPNGFFENLAFRKEFDPTWGEFSQLAEFPAQPRGWGKRVTKILKQGGYVDGPWAVKTFMPYWRFWDGFDPVWILPRRDHGRVLRSTRRAGYFKFLNDDQLLDLLKRIDRIQRFLRDTQDGVFVFPDAIVDGDCSSIKMALEVCGLKPDEALISQIVQPAYWGREVDEGVAA